MVEELRHRQAHQHRILHRPHIREVDEEAKLQRKRLLVLRNVSVHPGGIGLELRALRRRHVGNGPLRHLPQAENPLLSINLDVLRSKHCGQLAGSVTARHVHLPQPVLRGDVSLREQQVGQSLEAAMCGTPSESKVTMTGWVSPAR